MKLNTGNYNKNLNFRSAKAPNAEDIKNVRRFVDCRLDGLYTRLVESVKAADPNRIKMVDGVEYVSDYSATQKVQNCIKSFFGIPLDIVTALAKKFPNSRLYNSSVVQNHIAADKLQNDVNSFQGVFENGVEFINEAQQNRMSTARDVCVVKKQCSGFCSDIRDRYNEKLNKQMAYDVADYDTKNERFCTRLISGFTAAFFLGNDFYNKAIQKGKTPQQAKEEQKLKRNQEIKENICEGITQFAVFACFSKMINKSIWAPAIISTLIGFVSRIISRKSSNMPIFRIKVPKQNNVEVNMPSIDEYMDKSTQKNEDKKQIIKVKDENNKKPILSLKNILLFCGASIFAGYAYRFGKKYTKLGKQISKAVEKHGQVVEQKTTVDVVADKNSLGRLSNAIRNSGERTLADYIRLDIVEKPDQKANKIILGTVDKYTKVFGVDMKTKDLRQLPTAPINFVKEVIMYPYKIALKFENAIRKKPLTPQKVDNSDLYNIKNIYLRYMDIENKYKNNPEKIQEEFEKYIKQLRLLSNNSVTSSSTDNSKIAIISQTLGTLTGIWFNMNDEFNAAVRNGATEKEAQKDARYRGINKFFRMTVQVVITGVLNSLFAKQYNSSIAKSGLVVLASTILTDILSRVLTAMPVKKMTKEEMDKYQKDHNNTYYKIIDKLAS